MDDCSANILREGLGILASIIADDIIAKRTAITPTQDAQQGEDYGDLQDK